MKSGYELNLKKKKEKSKETKQINFIKNEDHRSKKKKNKGNFKRRNEERK